MNTFVGGRALTLFVEKGSDLDTYPEVPFKAEDDLQNLIATHPELLTQELEAVGRLKPFMLISREMPVSDSEAGSGRWSLDHLFVDRDGIPSLVEVKRAADTRIRREVVGQLLEYSSNGSKWWDAEQLARGAAAAAAEMKRDLASDLRRLLQEHLSATKRPEKEVFDTFWETVAENLRDGILRLIFVSDRLPSELVTIVEFLDRSMPKVDVFGVQVQQFSLDDKRFYVPSIRGLSDRPPQTGRRTYPTNDSVKRFLIAVREATREQLPEPYRELYVTKTPRKYVAFEPDRFDAGRVMFKVQFARWEAEVWSPMYVGLTLGTDDTDAHDRWMKKLRMLVEEGVLPESTKVESGGPHTVQGERVIPFDSEEELSDELVNEVALLLASYITVLMPIFEQATD